MKSWKKFSFSETFKKSYNEPKQVTDNKIITRTSYNDKVLNEKF